MRLRDYIVGRKIQLSSPLAPEEIARRIKAKTKLGFSPFAGGVTGGVWWGHMRLAWSIPLFSNGLRPIFLGNLKRDRGGTRIEASYGASAFVLAFFAIWYAMLCAITFVALSVGFEGPDAEVGAWMFGLTIPLFAVVPIGMHLVANRKANEYLEAILDHLVDVADLRP